MTSVVNALANTLEANAQQQVQKQVDAKLPGGWSATNVSVTIPKLTSANSTLTADIHPDGSVQLDFLLKNVTGSLTVSIPKAEKMAAGFVLFGPLGALGALALPDPGFNVSAQVDVKFNLPSPQTLMQLSKAGNFSLPGTPSVQATGIQVSAQHGNVLAALGMIANSVFHSFPTSMPLSIPQSSLTQIVTALSAAVSPLASALQETTKDGETSIQVVNQGGTLEYVADTRHTFYVEENSLAPYAAAGTWAPVLAKSSVSIGGQSGWVYSSSPLVYKQTASAAPGQGTVGIEIDVQNSTRPVVRWSGQVQLIGGQWYVHFSTGQTNKLFLQGGYWAVKDPNGSIQVTPFSANWTPSNFPPLSFTSVMGPPPGLNLTLRRIELTYNVLTGAITGMTSDGVKVSGQAGKLITVSGHSKGYPDVSFTISMDTPL
jgi:hypothetical protein